MHMKVVFKNYARKQRICINKYATVNTFTHAKTTLLNPKKVWLRPIDTS